MSKVTKIGRLRAHKAIDAISQELAAWNMSTWTTVDEKGLSFCGYTMCFAGWLNYLDPNTDFDLANGMATVGDRTIQTANRALELLLGRRFDTNEAIDRDTLANNIYFKVFLATRVDKVDELRELVNKHIGTDPRLEA